MTADDRRRWDSRYAGAAASAPAPPAAWPIGVIAGGVGGGALDVACGSGSVSVWLALAGYEVIGIDVSPAAIELAAALAADHGVADRCRFEVVDLDGGLAAAVAALGIGPASFDVVVCQRFRMPSIYPELAAALAPGGSLAVTVLSVVDHAADPGPFRAAPGELRAAFGPALTIEFELEGDGEAHLFGRR